MDTIALSKNGVLIRLPDERWEHIVQRHEDLASRQSEVLATVSDPVQVFAGDGGEYLAIRQLEPRKWIVVAYRELINDEFIITAYTARRFSSLKRQQLWP